MEKPVIISIRGVQSIEPGEEDVMELVTQGVLRQEEGEISLQYPESELTGLEGTLTTFRVADDRITLRREGILNSEMVFQEGQKHLSVYETPYGSLMLGTPTGPRPTWARKAAACPSATGWRWTASRWARTPSRSR